MQKWDYVVIELSNESNWIIAHYVNEEELEGWKHIPLPRFLNHLGELGWELTGALNGSANHTIAPGHLFFKRTLGNEPSFLVIIGQRETNDSAYLPDLPEYIATGKTRLQKASCRALLRWSHNTAPNSKRLLAGCKHTRANLPC